MLDRTTLGMRNERLFDRRACRSIRILCAFPVFPDAHVPFPVLASEQRKSPQTINMVAGAPRVASTTRRTTPQGHFAVPLPSPPEPIISTSRPSSPLTLGSLMWDGLSFLPCLYQDGAPKWRRRGLYEHTRLVFGGQGIVPDRGHRQMTSSRKQTYHVVVWIHAYSTYCKKSTSDFYVSSHLWRVK
jgi:hypothetical protein